MNRLRSIALCAIAGISLACGDGTGPPDVSGTYDLTQANQAPPPALVQATLSCDVFLDAATAVLASDGGFSLDFQQTTDCTRGGGQVTTDGFTLNGSYTARRDEVTFVIPGSIPLVAVVSGAQILATLPASPFTFPNPVALVFTRRT